jgi:integrase
VEDEGERTFTSEEITRMLAAAGQPLKAMILLAINAALGNSDLGQLRFAHISGRWLTYPRPKNENDRRCHLWQETCDALAEWMKQRPEPKTPADSKLVFLTKWGRPWHKEKFESPLSQEFCKLLDELKINGGRGFYNLRHTFRTEAGRCADMEAVSGVMGHSLPGMAKNYVQFIHDDRLQRVADVVHDWLFGSKSDK